MSVNNVRRHGLTPSLTFMIHDWYGVTRICARSIECLAVTISACKRWNDRNDTTVASTIKLASSPRFLDAADDADDDEAGCWRCGCCAAGEKRSRYSKGRETWKDVTLYRSK